MKYLACFVAGVVAPSLGGLVAFATQHSGLSMPTATEATLWGSLVWLVVGLGTGYACRSKWIGVKALAVAVAGTIWCFVEIAALQHFIS